MNARAGIGWLGFLAAGWWLYADYQAKAGTDTIDKAILAGWITVALIGAHIAIAYLG